MAPPPLPHMWCRRVPTYAGGTEERGGRAPGPCWHWVTDARRGLSSPRRWPGATGDPRWLGAADGRDAMGSSWCVSPPCTGQPLAGDQAAGSRSVPPGASLCSHPLWERAGVGRMGLLPPLHPGPAAGWAPLPCSPPSHCIPLAPLGQRERAFPRHAGDCCCLPAAAPAHPRLVDGLEPRRVCREMALSPAPCWLSTACWVKTSCIRLQGFNLPSPQG